MRCRPAQLHSSLTQAEACPRKQLCILQGIEFGQCLDPFTACCLLLFGRPHFGLFIDTYCVLCAVLCRDIRSHDHSRDSQGWCPFRACCPGAPAAVPGTHDTFLPHAHTLTRIRHCYTAHASRRLLLPCHSTASCYYSSMLKVRHNALFFALLVAPSPGGWVGLGVCRSVA